MADKKNDRRRRERNHHAAADTQLPPEFQIKEYNYVLHVDADDGKLLQAHREQLAAGTTDFAEVYYNFLFDNPDIADVLYSFERNGGDVGLLVRNSLENMLSGISGTHDGNRDSALIDAGSKLFDHRFRPVWVIASYNLLINYMIEMLAGMEIRSADRLRLETVQAASGDCYQYPDVARHGPDHGGFLAGITRGSQQ
jgi:hypothetical protein